MKQVLKDFLCILAGIVLGVLIVNFASGQCPDGLCPSQKKTIPQIHQEIADSYEWVKHNQVQFLLYKGSKIVGQWYLPEHTYYPWDGSKNLAPCKPPIDPPGKDIGHLEHWQKNGISTRHDREQLSYGGKVIQPHRLHAAFEGKLEDDSSKGNFVIVAKDAKARAAVFADWQRLPTDFTSRYNVWMPPVDHFSMQDRFNNKPRFFTEGDPTVILQNSEGVVLFRRPQCEQKYQSGDMQDLLKADPDYNPKLDPGAPLLGKLPFPITPQLIVASVSTLLLVVFVLFRVVVRLTQKRKS